MNINCKKIREKVEIQDIQKKLYRRCTIVIIIFLSMCIISIIAFYYFEKSEIIKKIKFEKEFLNSFFSIVSTMSTILTAIIIFFYSKQDNYKEGIPYRLIMAYTYGTWTVPVTFLISISILPMILYFQFEELNYTMYLSLIIVFVLQLILTILILLTTSWVYCVQAIFFAEVRQFYILKQIDKDKYNIIIWLYLLKHMVNVVKSEELIVEKTILIRELLWVPFCIRKKNEIFYFFKKNSKEKNRNINILNLDVREELYCFYYNNLGPVFEYLDNEIRREERDLFYLLLYDFIQDLIKKCNAYSNDIMENNCHMIISAIINAVLMSSSNEKEEFCDYIFTVILKDDKFMRINQIGLYILFQELLFIINPCMVCLNNLRKIESDIYIWKDNIKQLGKENFVKSHIGFWDIWMKWVSISKIDGYQHFKMAVNTIFDETNESLPMSYLMSYRGKEVKKNDNNNISFYK